MSRTVESHYSPDAYDYVPVAVFRTHERIKNGRNVKVDRTKLQAIADKHNGLWERYGRASPMSLGHTLDTGPDGAEVPETAQPDTAGAVLKLHIQEAPDEPDEYILWGLWCRPKDRKVELSKYMSLSPEYYPGRDLLYPFSLLKSSAPELPDMPALPLLYGVELKPDEEPPYRLLMTNPFHYSLPTETNEMNPFEAEEKKPTDDKEVKSEKSDPKKDDKKPEDAAKDKAVKAEEKGSKEDASDLSDIKQMLAQLMPVLPDLMQLVALMKEEGPSGDEDLMKPEGDKPPMGDKPEPKSAPVEKGKDEVVDDRKDAASPVKFDSSMGSATNGCVPGFSNSKEKEAYKMNDEMLKYKAEVEQKLKAKDGELAAVKKIAEDLNKKSRRQEAEKLVYSMETDHNIVMTAEVKAEEIDTLAALDPKSAEIYFKRACVRYQKKLPNSAAVAEVAKYAVEGEPELQSKTPEEAHERAMKIVKSGLSVEEFYKQLAAGKTK